VPSNRITQPLTLISTSINDAIGSDGALAGTVSHIGLADATGPQIDGEVAVIEMGPPLRGNGANGRMRIDVVGWADLTDDEIQKIRTFIDRHTNEHAAVSELTAADVLRKSAELYCIVPHASPYEESDGRYVRMRFSCAGFVVEAYRSARINLVEVDRLPLVDMETIKAAYPNQIGLIERERLSAESLGLGGAGPWPVLFCGYLFHSLGRTAEKIRSTPYVPEDHDRLFP
jgi:hypothetical protein